MRHSCLALTTLLLWTATTPSQPAQAPAQPTAAAVDPKLDALLLRWEQEMKKVDTLALECWCVEKSKTFEKVLTWGGTAKYMKPNLASLELRRKDKPEEFRKYVCTGTYLYEYSQQQKELRAHALPARKEGQVADDNFLSFLFGMKAEEAKRRYALKLVKEDQHYFYVQIQPRFAMDKADFEEARLVLYRDTFLPRQLWFLNPNKDETMWDMPRIQSGVQLNRQEFIQPTVPAGWKMVQVPRTSEVQPRIVRPNQ